MSLACVSIVKRPVPGRVEVPVRCLKDMLSHSYQLIVRAADHLNRERNS